MKTHAYLKLWGPLAVLSMAGWSQPALADEDKQHQATGGSSLEQSSGQSSAAGSSISMGKLERADQLIGKRVTTSDGQKAGKLDDIVVDLQSGRILYAIVDTGLTGKSMAVAPGAFSGSADNLRLSVDREKINSAPAFADRDASQLGQASFVHQVYQHFGQSAWWQGAAAANVGQFNNVHKASDLAGMNIKNVSDQNIGEVKAAMVDLPAGRVPMVIMSADRSLGLETDNYYALPPDALTLASDRKGLVSNITKERLASAPHFAKGNWAAVSAPGFASQVYQFYGKQAYFQSDDQFLSPTGRTNNSPSVYDHDDKDTKRQWNKEHRQWHKDNPKDRDADND